MSIHTLTYIGPHDAVDVQSPDGSYERTVQRGGSFQTTAEHAAALLEQTSNWAPAAPEKSKKPATSEKE